MSLKKIPLEKADPYVTGSGPGGYFIGKDFRAAYAPGVSLTGNGEVVGLLEFDGSTRATCRRMLRKRGWRLYPRRRCSSMASTAHLAAQISR